MVIETIPRPRCPKCNSTAIRFRHRTQEQVCDSCGYHWPKENLKA